MLLIQNGGYFSDIPTEVIYKGEFVPLTKVPRKEWKHMLIRELLPRSIPSLCELSKYIENKENELVVYRELISLLAHTRADYVVLEKEGKVLTKAHVFEVKFNKGIITVGQKRARKLAKKLSNVDYYMLTIKANWKIDKEYQCELD